MVLVACGVAGQEEYCPRSGKWVGTGDGKVVWRAYGVAGPRGKCGPGTEVPLTGDGNVVLVACGVAGQGEYCLWSGK